MAFCYACGMACSDDGYHPHAACLMFRQSNDAGTVEANLAAVLERGAAAERVVCAELVRARAAELADAIDQEQAVHIHGILLGIAAAIEARRG